MGQVSQEAWAYAKRTWPSKRAAAVLSLILGGGVVLSRGFDFSTAPVGIWILAATVGLAPWIVYVVALRPPRHKRGRIGFGVAIMFEEEGQETRVRADFVETLERLLRSRSRDSPWHFIEFPRRFAAGVKDHASAERLLFQARGHFLIHGRSRLRQINGKATHVLDLEGIVRHAHVGKPVSDKLSGEFREVMPRNLLIAQENDLFTLQFTAQWVDTVARYIVGIAALISGDIDLAERLFVELESELGRVKEGGSPAVALIRNRLPDRIGEVLRIRVRLAADRYNMSGSRTHLSEVEPLLDRLQAYDSAWYTGHLLRAICAFELHNDLAAAHAALDKCAGIPEPTWRYSRAFLHAYEGKLDQAWDEYRPAFHKSLEEASVPIQAELFMHRVLAREPERAQLYFCLGMINHRVKEDLASARRDFSQFLSATDPTTFPKQRALAEKWISKIDRGQPVDAETDSDGE